MQIRQNTFESRHFQCPFDHEEKGKCLLKHGTYERYVHPHGNAKVAISRHLCKFTGKTLSVLPDNMLPYWPLPVSDLDEHFERRSAGEERSAAEPGRNHDNNCRCTWRDAANSPRPTGRASGSKRCQRLRQDTAGICPLPSPRQGQ